VNTAQTYLRERDKLRDLIETAEKRVSDITFSANWAKSSAEAATADLEDVLASGQDDDRAPSLREVVAKRQAELGTLARQREDTDMALRGLRRKLTAHDANARTALLHGINELRAEVAKRRAEIEAEWNAAGRKLRELTGQLAALDGTVPPVQIGAGSMSEKWTIGIHGLEYTFSDLCVPKIGTGGLDPRDRLVDKWSARDTMPRGAHTDLAAQHAALAALAAVVEGVEKVRAA
jgi:hypothetical protein